MEKLNPLLIFTVEISIYQTSNAKFVEIVLLLQLLDFALAFHL